MLVKTRAIDRFLAENPYLKERRFGLPNIGVRNDGERFNPTVQAIADAIDYYGYEVRDEHIATIPDIDLGNGNPMNYGAFPLAVEEMKKSLDSNMLYRYPYTEGDDNIRKVLLNYVESLGFINTQPYSYKDIDKNGLAVHNITFLPSTSILFNIIVETITKPGDVILMTGPCYGLFAIRAERAGAEVEIIDLEKEDNFLIHPKKLADKIDDINESLQKAYHRRRKYVPRVVAFLNENPNNPTGRVMGEKESELLAQIGEICLSRGVFVIDDLVYRDIGYDGENLAKPIATIPGMFRNTISLFGLSKSYGLASLRAGFVVADERIIRQVVNKTFQSMDSPPDIVGQALKGAFQVSKQREKVYQEYFTDLRQKYQYNFQLLKAMTIGIDTIEDFGLRVQIKKEVQSILGETEADKILTGLPYVKFPENLEPESGFFAILDFTEIKGMKFEGRMINTERDLLNFFYQTSRTRFLIGQSICWPYRGELIGRITYSIENEKLVRAFMNMYHALEKLTPKENYVIRKNELKDQEQMAHIKVDGWKSAYDKIVAASYLKSLNYEEQTERYIHSFEEYKDRVLVAVKGDEVLGYSCFDPKNSDSLESELVSLYIKPNEKGKGIGTALVKETCKELILSGKKNMMVWCFEDNLSAIEFYETLGGKKIETKQAKIGEEWYTEYGFYFNLEEVISK